MSISASRAIYTATFSNNYTEATLAIRGVVQSVYVRPRHRRLRIPPTRFTFPNCVCALPLRHP
jgi:hypothetical protein